MRARPRRPAHRDAVRCRCGSLAGAAAGLLVALARASRSARRRRCCAAWLPLRWPGWRVALAAPHRAGSSLPRPPLLGWLGPPRASHRGAAPRLVIAWWLIGLTPARCCRAAALLWSLPALAPVAGGDRPRARCIVGAGRARAHRLAARRARRRRRCSGWWRAEVLTGHSLPVRAGRRRHAGRAGWHGLARPTRRRTRSARSLTSPACSQRWCSRAFAAGAAAAGPRPQPRRSTWCSAAPGRGSWWRSTAATACWRARPTLAAARGAAAGALAGCAAGASPWQPHRRSGTGPEPATHCPRIPVAMSVLRNLEAKLESSWRARSAAPSRPRVQPVELARKLAKEMEENQVVSVSRIYVPNEYAVFLSPTDREQFASYEGGAHEGAVRLPARARPQRGPRPRHAGPRSSSAPTSGSSVGEFGIQAHLIQPPDEETPASTSRSRPTSGTRWSTRPTARRASWWSRPRAGRALLVGDGRRTVLSGRPRAAWVEAATATWWSTTRTSRAAMPSCAARTDALDRRGPGLHQRREGERPARRARRAQARRRDHARRRPT